MDFYEDEEKMRDFFTLTKDEFLQTYSYLKETDYDATAIKVNENLGNISRLSILKELLEQTNHNIECYSDNYLMTRPKKQYISEWKKEIAKQRIIKSMIKDEKSRNMNKHFERKER